MKTIITAIALAAGLASAHATPRVTVESLTTTYAPREPFMHVADQRSYLGTFEAKQGVCALTVEFGPLGDEAPQQIAFELPARQTIRFGGDGAGSAVHFTCGDDAQSLVINQTWGFEGNAKAATLEGQHRLKIWIAGGRGAFVLAHRLARRPPVEMTVFGRGRHVGRLSQTKSRAGASVAIEVALL